MDYCNSQAKWIVCAVLVLNQALVRGDESALSNAYGLGALNRIVRDEELRGKLAIADEQLLDIRKILSEKKMFVSDEKTNNNNAKQYLKNKLTQKQLAVLRIEFVKQQFETPVRLFEPAFLMEIGVDSEKATEIYISICLLAAEVSKKTDKLRIEAISNALPPDAQDVLWKFVGKNFAIEEHGVDWNQIQVLSEATVLRQLTFAPFMSIPEKLSGDQTRLLQELGDKVGLERAKGEFRTVEVSAQLDSILSRSQRFAIVQRMQQEILRGDLLVAIRPEIAKHFNVSDELLSEARDELADSKKVIEEAERLQLVQACNEVLKSVPLPVKKVITELADGVWAFN